jgi:hypothetical protein
MERSPADLIHKLRAYADPADRLARIQDGGNTAALSETPTNNHARYQIALHLLDFYGAYTPLITAWSEVAKTVDTTVQPKAITLSLRRIEKSSTSAAWTRSLRLIRASRSAISRRSRMRTAQERQTRTKW